jgi:hypothetical protein
MASKPLPEKARLLALAMAQGKSVKAFCETAEVPERTAFSWAARTDFKELVASLRERMVNDALGKITALATRAVETLEKLMADEQPPRVRLGAAKTILGGLIELQNHAELTARVIELERKAKARESSRA